MSILAKILAIKRIELAAAQATSSLADLEARITALGADPILGRRRPFEAALRCPPGESIRVIAEFKRASPSAGAIAAGAAIEPVVAAYADGGATAISVLTDKQYFDGDPSFLLRARAQVGLPLLRKDFLIDPYQVVEAKALGADAVLLIVAALDDVQLSEMLAVAEERGLDALVEVHDEEEARRAVDAGARVIGVNHRNLKTFEMDMGLTSRLRGSVPEALVLVGESGIRGRDEVVRLHADGADAVLVGETLMRSADPAAVIRELRA